MSNATPEHTIEELEKKIEDLTNSAEQMCRRAVEQEKKMQKYVDSSAQLEALMSSLDSTISSKDTNMVEAFNRLVQDQPKHTKLITDMHKQLQELQKKQQDISNESSDIAIELVNLNKQNHAAHKNANRELDSKVVQHALTSKLAQKAHDTKNTKNYNVNREFLEKMALFVQHVDQMIHCQMDKGSAFQIICEELSSVKEGLDTFTTHLTSNNEKDSNALLAHQTPAEKKHTPISPVITYATALNNKPTRLGIRSDTIPAHKP